MTLNGIVYIHCVRRTQNPVYRIEHHVHCKNPHNLHPFKHCAHQTLCMYIIIKTSYGFLQKPLVPASLDEVTVGTYWLKIGKSEDQVEGEIDKIKTK